jgi:endonuclease-3 related protein
MLLKIYDILLRSFGPQNWWPTKSDNKIEEIMIGAILTQQTSWRNVEKSIDNLISANCLSLKKISNMKLKEIENLIRPCGFYRLKSKRLKEISLYFSKKYKDLEDFFRKSLEECRKELLSLNGIGYETCDAILLYAGNKPIFVVDRYTYRILSRMRIWNNKFHYEKLRIFIESQIPQDLKLYKEFHALFDELAKRYCRFKPLCEGCPLIEYCKHLK